MFLEHGGNFLEFAVEPFQTTYGKLAIDSAYPHSDSPLPVSQRAGMAHVPTSLCEVKLTR